MSDDFIPDDILSRKNTFVPDPKYTKRSRVVVDDPVNSPVHYKRDDIECIDAMKQTTPKEGFEEYCRLNAFKYIWRANNKSKREEDIKKAIWYLRMSIGDDPRAES